MDNLKELGIIIGILLLLLKNTVKQFCIGLVILNNILKQLKKTGVKSFPKKIKIEIREHDKNN